jgi:predicted TIM-barrel fold metal-dependent hydrolase
MEDMAHVYYDVAGFSEQKQLEMLLRNVDITHLVYGSDTPYTDITACIGQTEALENTTKLTEAQKQLIFTDNARALLGLTQ